MKEKEETNWAKTRGKQNERRMKNRGKGKLTFVSFPVHMHAQEHRNAQYLSENSLSVHNFPNGNRSCCAFVGNVEFAEIDSESCRLVDSDPLERCAELLKCSSTKLRSFCATFSNQLTVLSVFWVFFRPLSYRTKKPSLTTLILRWRYPASAPLPARSTSCSCGVRKFWAYERSRFNVKNQVLMFHRSVFLFNCVFVVFLVLLLLLLPDSATHHPRSHFSRSFGLQKIRSTSNRETGQIGERKGAKS